MLKMRPYAPPDRIAIRDSIDEEASDDIEDDVFIRDGKSRKSSEEKGLKKPLMAPRRKNSKTSTSVPIMKKHRRWWTCCEPFCMFCLAITILIALIFLAALLLTLFPIPLQKIKIWLHHESPYSGQLKSFSGISEAELVPCSQISVQRVWSKTFARLNSESPIRKVDLNGDKVDDIIFGFGVDDSIQYEEVDLPKCRTATPHEEEVICDGGVIALNGVSGEILWQRWAIANVFSVLCSIDIDKDGYLDCIAAGRVGLIFAINGRNGNVIWNFRETEVETNSPILIDLYTINAIRDLDGDEVPDILAVHVEEREITRSGHIKVISGKTGKVIRTIPTPFREEVFVPLQIVTKEDGTELLLIITGGQNTPGGVYTIRLQSIMQFTSEREFIPLFQTESSGFMVPAVLTDLNGDLIEDIVTASFNSTVYAFDGRNYSIIWSYSFSASESVSAIVPGHFDHDNVTDFMVKYNTGPGFPVYYYSQTAILSGATGQPLLDSIMTDSGGPNSLLGGISISQTFGGDFFLHWQTQCRGKFDVKDAYQFVPDSDIVLQARADTCLLRYNTTTVLKLYAIARHVEPPGAVIFSSDDLNLRLNRTENRQLVQPNSVSPIKHPKMLKKLLGKDAIRSDDQSQPIVTHNGEKKHKELLSDTNIFRKPIFEPQVVNFPQQETPERGTYEQIKPYLYLPFGNQAAGREFKEYESDPRNQDEYENLYNDDQQNERPIRLRSKYPNSRDVRSDFFDYDNDITNNETVIRTTAKPIITTFENVKLDNDRRLNLWDLELEKEEEETMSEVRKLNYGERQLRDETIAKMDQDDSFLPSISSTGILLEALQDKSASAIDFAFILNVRESEIYPPLFLPEDLACVEEKVQRYKGYSTAEVLEFEKQALQKCLRARNVNFARRVPRYESQIVITRISITCTCGDLQMNNGEVCSRLENIEKQRWTQFMGNGGDGIYNKKVF